MERLTERVEDKVYYSKGKYPPTTLCAEMETWEVRECMQKLAEYEDLEEQGLLIKLPCKVGDVVWCIDDIDEDLPWCLISKNMTRGERLKTVMIHK